MNISVKVPEGAKYQTWDKDGCMKFWRGHPYRESSYKSWFPSHEGDFLGSVETGIPCGNWRNSLQELPTHQEADHASDR